MLLHTITDNFSLPLQPSILGMTGKSFSATHTIITISALSENPFNRVCPNAIRKVCNTCFSYLEKYPNNIGKAVSGKMPHEADLDPGMDINHSWGRSQCIFFTYPLARSPCLWLSSESFLYVCYP